MAWPLRGLGQSCCYTRRLSKGAAALDVIAEVVHGKAGTEGTRMAEFYRGEEFRPGMSGWYEVPPSITVRIPAMEKPS